MLPAAAAAAPERGYAKQQHALPRVRIRPGRPSFSAFRPIFGVRHGNARRGRFPEPRVGSSLIDYTRSPVLCRSEKKKGKIWVRPLEPGVLDSLRHPVIDYHLSSLPLVKPRYPSSHLSVVKTDGPVARVVY